MADKNDIRAGGASVELSAKDNTKGVLDAASARLRAWGKGIAVIGGMVAGAGAAVAGGMIAMATNAAQAGQEWLRLSHTTGVSVENLSALGYAANRVGVSTETFTHAFGHMSMAVAEAARGSPEATQKLADLGLTIEDLAHLSQDDRFRLIADRISRIGDAAQRATAERGIFGRSGIELAPLIDQGASGIRGLEAEGARKGRIWTTEDAQNSQLFLRNVNALQGALKTVWEMMGRALLRPLIAGTEHLKKIAEKIIEVTTEVSNWMRENEGLLTVLFKIFDWAIIIGPAIAAVGGALALVPSAVGLIGTAWSGLGMLASGLGSVLMLPFTLMQLAATGAAAVVSLAWSGLVAVASFTWGAIVAVAEVAWGAITATWAFGTAACSFLMTAFGATASAVAALFSTAWTVGTAICEGALLSLAAVGVAVDAVLAFFGGTVAFVATIFSTAWAIGAGIASAATWLWNAAIGAGSALMGLFSGGAIAGTAAAGAWSVGAVAAKLATWLLNIALTAADALLGGIPLVIGLAVVALGVLAGAILGVVGAIALVVGAVMVVAAAVLILPVLWAGIAAGAVSLWRSIQSGASSLGDYLTNAFGPTLTTLGQMWQNLSAVAVAAWGGIVDAIQSGNIGLAMRIVWAAARVAWYENIDLLGRAWDEFTTFLGAVFSDAWNNIGVLATQAWGALQAGWFSAVAAMSNAWADFSYRFTTIWETVIAAVLIGIRRAIDAILPAAAVAGLNNLLPASLQSADAIRANRDANIERARRERDRTIGVNTGEADYNSAMASSEAQIAADEQASRGNTATAPTNAQNAQNARDELEGLVGQAADEADDRRRMAVMRRHQAALDAASRGGALAMTGAGSRGAFNVVDAAGQFGGDGPAERTARACEQANDLLREVRDVIRTLNLGGVQFN